VPARFQPLSSVLEVYMLTRFHYSTDVTAGSKHKQKTVTLDSLKLAHYKIFQ